MGLYRDNGKENGNYYLGFRAILVGGCLWKTDGSGHPKVDKILVGFCKAAKIACFAGSGILCLLKKGPWPKVLGLGGPALT